MSDFQSAKNHRTYFCRPCHCARSKFSKHRIRNKLFGFDIIRSAFSMCYLTYLGMFFTTCINKHPHTSPKFLFSLKLFKTLNISVLYDSCRISANNGIVRNISMHNTTGLDNNSLPDFCSGQDYYS